MRLLGSAPKLVRQLRNGKVHRFNVPNQLASHCGGRQRWVHLEMPGLALDDDLLPGSSELALDGRRLGSGWQRWQPNPFHVRPSVQPPAAAQCAPEGGAASSIVAEAKLI